MDIYYQGMAVLVTQEDFYHLAYAYLAKAQSQNVTYAEIFFDPQAHLSRGVSFATLIQGSGITITNGAGTITIAADSTGGLTWSAGVTTGALAAGTGSFVTAGSQQTLTLPTGSSLVGDTIAVANAGSFATAWTIAQNASQAIKIGNTTTSTGTGNLAVEGMIEARKIKVLSTGWADYVFDKSYSLPSLQSVATYIAQNKHLPDLPSAATIAKDGLDLGDNQARLLKKIEELTLYMIQQQKMLKEQGKEIESLKKRLSH